MFHRSKPALAGLAVAFAQFTLPVAAQELETVTVTARKTEEKLQEAPVAVSAFTAADIESQGMRSIDDLAKFTPGLSFSQAYGRTLERPIIRGQSNVMAGFQFGVESGTAYFIDGIYYPGDIQGLDFGNLERVEVVKGPQSALYGRNTYAGAINFITRQPTGPEARVKASFADHGEREYSFAAGNVFLDGKLGVRLSGRSYEYGGEYVNQLTNKRVGQESTDSLGLSLKYEPTQNVQVTFTGLYRKDDDGPLAQFLQSADLNNCMPGYRSSMYRDPPGDATTGPSQYQYFCGVVRPGVVRMNTDPLPVTVGGQTQIRDGTAFDGVEKDEWFSALRIDWDIGGSGWIATAMGGYRDAAKWLGVDDYADTFSVAAQYNPAIGATAFPDNSEPAGTTTTRTDYIDSSIELRVASPSDRRVRGIFGVYRFDYDADTFDLTFEDPRRGPAVYSETVENKAVFGLVSFDITDRLTLTGELRYMEEYKTRKDYCAPAVGSGDYNYFTGTCTNLSAAVQPGNPRYYNYALGTTVFSDDMEFSSTTPRLTLDWQLNDNTLLYGVYARGAKPGGLNGLIGRTVGVPTYAQEESDNYELGVKWTSPSNRMRVNGSVYLIEATDVQFSQSINPPGSATAVAAVATNQGEGEIYGVELETQIALSEAFTLAAAYAYTHTEVVKGCDDFEYVLNSGGLIYNPQLGPVPECSVAGRRYPLGPETTASVALSYDSPLPWGEGLSLFGNLTTTYEGTKYLQLHNLAHTGDTTLVNLRLGVRSDSGWTVALFGRNLTDEDTIPLGQRTTDRKPGTVRLCTTYAEPCVPTAVQPGTPGGADVALPRTVNGALRKGRTFGIEFSYDFAL
jgi:iron complex outermembrane receptor protein